MIDFFNLEFNDTNNTPKYKQIVESISQLIQSGNIKYGQKLPSINQVSFDYYSTIIKVFLERFSIGIHTSRFLQEI